MINIPKYYKTKIEAMSHEALLNYKELLLNLLDYVNQKLRKAVE